jgi:hypothetical protein
MRLRSIERENAKTRTVSIVPPIGAPAVTAATDQCGKCLLSNKPLLNVTPGIDVGTVDRKPLNQPSRLPVQKVKDSPRADHTLSQLNDCSSLL